MTEQEIQSLAKIGARELIQDFYHCIPRHPSRHGIVKLAGYVMDDLTYVASEANKAASHCVPSNHAGMYVEWFGRFFWSEADRRRDWQAGIYR